MSLVGTCILVVEDSDAQYRDIRRMLLDTQPEGQMTKYIIQRAETLVEALKNISSGYDLILLDLNLPDSIGLNTFDQVNVQAIKHGNVPIIVTTVLEDLKLGFETYKAGAAMYIVKSWLDGNPLLLHFLVSLTLDSHRQATKLQGFMLERVGQRRPLIQRCKACEPRIGVSRWKAESTGEWMIPDKYIEEAAINFTDGVCPECFEVYYKPQLDQTT